MPVLHFSQKANAPEKIAPSTRVATADGDWRSASEAIHWTLPPFRPSQSSEDTNRLNDDEYE